jgi:hypothetical protein
MTRAHALLALAASGALLAGCTPAPDMPAPITYAEAKKQQYEQQLAWWTSMFPDEPMPEVEPIAYVEPNSSSTAVIDCLRAADPEGIAFAADGSWSSSSTSGTTDGDRAMFICSMQYPYDVSDPSAMGMLSEDESEWLWGYNQERLAPCLELLGYTVNRRVGDYVPGSRAYWSPYWDITPMPVSAGEWDRIDLRCPPPRIGPVYRPSFG